MIRPLLVVQAVLPIVFGPWRLPLDDHEPQPTLF